jgi:hypothetical protein
MIKKNTYDGYIVNVYNVLNYDIDIPLLKPEKYKNVIINQYTYQCVKNDIELGDIKTGQSYRCRLNGLLINNINKETNNDNYGKNKLKNTYIYEINKQIDRANGWVKCDIIGVDMFNRLLVDIYIPDLQFNIKNYLIQDQVLFQEYKKTICHL